jgi:hypothetical protein
MTIGWSTQVLESVQTGKWMEQYEGEPEEQFQNRGRLGYDSCTPKSKKRLECYFKLVEENSKPLSPPRSIVNRELSHRHSQRQL